MEKLPLKAFGRSLSDFEPLKSAEKMLLEACRMGEIAFISEIRPEQPNEHNTVRAGFVRFLALGGDEQALVHEMGVPLHGAWVEGDLYMDSATLPHNLVLIQCHLSNIILRNSKVHGFISFDGCHINDLIADRMICSNSVFLKHGFIATGTVSLQSVHIGCDLMCDKGEFHGKDDSGNALSCDGAVIKGNVLLRNDFTATGTVRLLNSQIGGSLECCNGKFDGKGSTALLCDGAVIEGNVSLNNGFTATGSVQLPNIEIGGSLYCNNSKFDGNDGDALSCEGALINGGVFLNNGFTATGTVRLRGAQINGVLYCSNGKFDGKGSDALMCEDAIVKKNVFLIEGFSAIGTVRLRSVQIGGTLICKGTFNGNGGNALLCDGAVIKGGVFFNGGFSAIGEVRILEVQIGGSLECRDATFDVQPDNQRSVLSCDRAVIKGSVFIVGKFVATGTVSFQGVQIAGGMECHSDVTLIGGDNGIALQADGMTVAGAFHFYRLNSVKGNISLLGVKVGGLIDGNQSWLVGELSLNGFVYDKLAGSAPTDATTRLAWLDKQSKSDTGLDGIGKDFKPQPWQQLQKVLREMGHIEDARQVAIAFEDRLRKANLIGQTNCYKPIAWIYQQICCFFHWCFGWLIGYGYRPLRLFIIMVFIWLACGGFYWYAALYGNQGDGVFAPSNPLVFQNPEYAVCVSDSDAAKMEKNKPANAVQGAGNWYLCEKLREEYTGFSSLVYSLDLILPLVDLQQEHDWSPMIPTPKKHWYCEFTAFSLKRWTRLVMWFEILFGWMASLLLVAVVSGLTKRREE